MALPQGPRHARTESAGVRPVAGSPWRTPGTRPRHAKPEMEASALPMPEAFSMPVVVEEHYLFGRPEQGRMSMSALSKRVGSFIVEAQTEGAEGVSTYGFNVVDGRVAIYGLNKHSGGRYTVTGDRIVLGPNSEVRVETGQDDPRDVMHFALGEHSMTLFAERGNALRVLAPDEFFVQPQPED